MGNIGCRMLAGIDRIRFPALPIARRRQAIYTEEQRARPPRRAGEPSKMGETIFWFYC